MGFSWQWGGRVVGMGPDTVRGCLESSCGEKLVGLDLSPMPLSSPPAPQKASCSFTASLLPSILHPSAFPDPPCFEI